MGGAAAELEIRQADHPHARAVQANDVGGRHGRIRLQASTQPVLFQQLREHGHRTGDIRPAERARLLFLETLLAAKQKIYSRYVDPKNNQEDRHWFEEQIPLLSYGDQDIRITLATGPGPANDSVDDWGVWAEPQIVLSGN